MRRLALALACGTLALAPGCGGDDEGTGATTPTAVPVPTIPDDGETAPETSPEQAPETEPEASPPPADPGSGGSPAPAPAPRPDSPQNDRPPPEDSPAQRFEEFCEQNPGACG